MDERVYVSWELMEAFLIDAFRGYGVPDGDARLAVDVLLESDRRGIESHGCNRFKPIYIDRIVDGIQNPVTHFEILRGDRHHRGGGRARRYGPGGGREVHADGHR